MDHAPFGFTFARVFLALFGLAVLPGVEPGTFEPGTQRSAFLSYRTVLSAPASGEPPFTLWRHFVELSHEGLAEQVGVEPTHGFRRLSVFKTAPLGHLGTVPCCRAWPGRLRHNTPRLWRGTCYRSSVPAFADRLANGGAYRIRTGDTCLRPKEVPLG